MDSRYEVIAGNRRRVPDHMGQFSIHQRNMDGSTDRYCGTV